jgi:hypothetical protein
MLSKSPKISVQAKIGGTTEMQECNFCSAGKGSFNSDPPPEIHRVCWTGFLCKGFPSS